MWSYRRDFGPVRLLVIDSRCGRILADGRRSMISDAEFEWVERQTSEGGYDHLVVGTSMPWLLPRALHDIESWNEALAAGSRGRVMGRLAEWIRRLDVVKDRKSTRLNSSHLGISYAVFCLKKKKQNMTYTQLMHE